MAEKTLIYDLAKDYTTDSSADSSLIKDASLTPYWILAVFRLANPISFDRNTFTQSDLFFPSQMVDLRGPVIIISGDCVNLNISNNKRSPIKSLVATLKQSKINYLKEILPGDWIMAWIVDSKEKFNDIIKRIKKQEACNKFTDGFKFVGRVFGIGKDVSKEPMGRVSISTTLECVAFKEFETKVFYDHTLARNQDVKGALGIWLARIGLDVFTLFGNELKNGNLDDNVHTIIPSLFKILLGTGLQREELNPLASKGIPTVTGSQSGTDLDSPPFAYLVPKQIGSLLGRSSSKQTRNGTLPYADLIELIFGIQEYPGNNDKDGTDESKIFTPHIDYKTQLTVGLHKFTGKKMLGAFTPQYPTFDNAPLWGVFQQFLNPAINEMYTCLRVNDEGNIVPTLVLRQIPFTTEAIPIKQEAVVPLNNENIINNPDSLKKQQQSILSEDTSTINATRFLSLPRWLLKTFMVDKIKVGTSDSTRCNFVKIQGVNPNKGAFTLSQQSAVNPPIRDDFDIARSGLHPITANVNCGILNTAGKVPTKWMRLVADWMIGMQFTLNGTINSIGIYSPICEGDNLEFNGVVYHIEGVTHNCSQNSEGLKTFDTTLTVSNGMNVNQDSSDPRFFPAYPSISKNSDNAFLFNLGITNDGDNVQLISSDDDVIAPDIDSKKGVV